MFKPTEVVRESFQGDKIHSHIALNKIDTEGEPEF